MSENQTKIGFFKKILNEIVVINENPQKATPQPIVAPKTPVEVGIANTSPGSLPVPSGTIDQKFLDHFENLLKNINIPGPDYLEFTRAIEGLEEMGFTEEQKFRAAWNTFTAMGGSEDKKYLIDTAQKYIDSLNQDKNNYLSAIQNRVQVEVGGLNTKLSELENRNQAIADQIAKLQTEVQQNNQEISVINAKISEQTAKITNNKNNYEVTHGRVVGQIQDDVTKINQYIQK